MKRDKRWYRIKADLEEKGTSLAAIAEKLGKTRSALSKVKTVPIPEIQKAIADALGVEPETIWPTRYRRDGTPVVRRIWEKSNVIPRPGHCQKRKAA